MNKEEKYTFREAMKGLSVMYETTKGHRRTLFFVLLSVIALGILNATFPLVFGRVIDAIVSKSDHVLGTMAVLAAVLFSVNFLSNIQGRFSSYVDESMRLGYMHRIYAHLLKLPIAFHKTNRQGELSEKINRGVQAIPSFWSDYVFNLLPQIAYIAFSIVFVFRAEHRIGVILVGATVLYVAVSVSFVQAFVRLQRAMQNAYTRAKGIANDAVFNVRMVKEAAYEEKESQRMKTAWFDDSMIVRQKMLNQNRNLALVQGIIANTSRLIGLWIAYTAVRDGYMTIGVFSALATYAAGFFSPLQQMFRQWRSIQNNLISMEDSDKLLRETPEKYQGVAPDMKGNVIFRNASFSYDHVTPVLKDVSFEIHPGQVIAFVGESGVGKSSLIDLISGYYLPESGSVLIDGVDTREIDLTVLRSSIAVVSQEITLFNSSVLENIRYGMQGITDERVKWAAEMAKCDFIERLPYKWEQLVGERGMKLSVGQKQRIAIARAFLRNPKILVLDEPTSALDAASENHIVQSLDEIMKDRTTLIIAHRLSTVRKADRILVFKEGRIVEQGTYKELVEKGGEFRRLRDLQTLNE